MRRYVFVLLAAALLAVPTATFAGFQTGDYELTLNGSGAGDNNFDNNFFSLQGSLGYFFSEVMEGLVRQEASFASSEDDSSWSGSTSFGADLHFDLQTFVPFVGASLGYVYGEGVDDTWFASPEGGVKLFVNATTFIQGLVQYQWFFNSASQAGNNFDDGRFVYVLGLGFRW